MTCILHHIEDDLVVITVAEVKALGVPLDELVETIIKVRCVFDDGDSGDILISHYIGEPLGTESSDPLSDEDNKVTVTE